jgi:3-hydroxybutyryl-CoA dehydrogenase
MLTSSQPPGGAGHGFRRAAVVGAGLMGRGIAGVLAAGGLDVTLYDVQPDVLSAAVTAAQAVAREAAAPAARQAGHVGGAADLAGAVGHADLVMEAVAESLPVKQDLFAQVSTLAPAGAVLATNTSVLPVTAIADRAAGPERVLGTHWWNPPDLMPVVEVVPGGRTAVATTERVITLLEQLGKTPVRVHRDVPGFIGNRLQHALWREAIALVADGICDPDTADLVARNTIGLRLARMGPLENADYVGLDLTLAIHDAVLPSLSQRGAPSPLLRDLVARGDLGAKTGRGFLPWAPGTRETARRELAAHVRAQRPSRAARCADPRPADAPRTGRPEPAAGGPQPASSAAQRGTPA